MRIAAQYLRGFGQADFGQARMGIGFALAARNAKSVFQSGLLARSNPVYQLAHSFAKSGALRDPIRARAQFHKKTSWRTSANNPDEEKAHNWVLDPKLSLGLLGEDRGAEFTLEKVEAMVIDHEAALARRLATVVAVTGEVDYVTDGERVLSVAGGNPLMTRVVGTGCALSAVVAASAALPGDRLENVAAACGLMKQAGEIAARQGGPGSFIPAFLDALYQEVQG